MDRIVRCVWKDFETGKTFDESTTHTLSLILGSPSVWSIKTLHLIERTYIISYRDKHTQLNSKSIQYKRKTKNKRQ